MKRLLQTFLAAFLLLVCAIDCCAARMWSEWETAAREKFGPTLARGALLYLQGIGNAQRVEVPLPFREVAGAARLDVLGLAWSVDAYGPRQEVDLLQFVRAEIARVREQGYSRIALAGDGPQARLAIAAVAQFEVDVLFALGPIALQGEDLPGLLARSKAKRVAIILFSGDDTDDDLHGGRVTAFRAALSKATEAFVVIDLRSGEADEDSKRTPGRFTRRYRDCLVELFVASRLPAGERQCDLSKGYAAGSDMWYRIATPVTRLPFGADPALSAFLGRWQGDEVHGAYVILSSVRIGPDTVDFDHGYSPRPDRSAFRPMQDTIRFRLEQGGTLMTGSFQNAEGSLRPRAANELVYVLTYATDHRQEIFRLRRRAEQR